MHYKVLPSFRTSFFNRAKKIPFLKNTVDKFKSIVGFNLFQTIYYKDLGYLANISILDDTGALMPEMDYRCRIERKTYEIFYYIYFLLDENFNLLYIGQTKCRDRITQHSDKRHSFTQFAYVPIFDENFDILKIEKTLIQIFNPILNKKHTKRP